MFPSQALSCTGSTGIISAFLAKSGKHPNESSDKYKINLIGGCHFYNLSKQFYWSHLSVLCIFPFFAVFAVKKNKPQRNAQRGATWLFMQYLLIGKSQLSK